jgi:hypothetical protein
VSTAIGIYVSYKHFHWVTSHVCQRGVMWRMYFDVIKFHFVFNVNINLGDIIKHAIHFCVVLKIVVSEYKDGYS